MNSSKNKLRIDQNGYIYDQIPSWKISKAYISTSRTDPYPNKKLTFYPRLSQQLLLRPKFKSYLRVTHYQKVVVISYSPSIFLLKLEGSSVCEGKYQTILVRDHRRKEAALHPCPKQVSIHQLYEDYQLGIVINVLVEIDSVEFVIAIDEFGTLYFPLEFIFQNTNQKIFFIPIVQEYLPCK